MNKKKNNENKTAETIALEITVDDILNLLKIKGINIKNKAYAEENIIIRRKNRKTTFDIIVTDIDGQTHQVEVEVKTYL